MILNGEGEAAHLREVIAAYRTIFYRVLGWTNASFNELREVYPAEVQIIEQYEDGK